MPRKALKTNRTRLKRILNALNPNSPRKAALAFAIIFAVGGAGYYLFTTYAGGYLKHNFYDISRNGYTFGASEANDSISSKSHVKVWRVVPGGYAGTSFTVFPLSYENFRACTLLRAGSTIGVTTLKIGTSAFEENVSFWGSPEYRKVCGTRTYTLTPLHTYHYYGVTIYNTTSTDLYIANIELQW